MKIFSFYGDVPELPRGDELRLTILWREKWKSAGWEPVILSEWQARQHPHFEEYDAAISKLPSCNPPIYEKFCFYRWIALAQVGGGWLADYDLFATPNGNPLWHRLTGAEMNKVIIMQQPCCPCLVWCSADNAIRLCREFAKGIGNNPQDARAHFSDQYSLERLVLDGADWIEVRNVVKQYPDEGCKDAPLIHYPNAALGPRNLTPKWRHIPKLLPL